MKYKNFLIWWMGMLAMVGGFYFLWQAEFLDLVWKGDATKISFLIVIGLFGVYGRLGRLIYQKEFARKVVSSFDLEPGYEAADQAMALGMLGTVVGFIIMTASFAAVDFSNVENIKTLLVIATEGMATALYTTVAGLIASIIIRLSHYLFERSLNA